jgi:hypothetical protein
MIQKLALLAGLCYASVCSAEVMYLVDSRVLLVTLDTTNPTGISINLIRGLQPGEGIVGIDFRPVNKQLYALGSSSRLYTIDTRTAQATQVGTGRFATLLEGTEFGVDFNPTVDRLRVVSNTGQNLRLHPDTGAIVAVDMPLRYADGMTPNAVASAYTNSVPNATSTTLYNLDARRKVLVTQIPPNDGVLNVVAPFNIDLSELAGFDISPNNGQAFIMGRHANSSTCALYRIDLTSGATTQLLVMPYLEQLSGLAIQPE